MRDEAATSRYSLLSLLPLVLLVPVSCVPIVGGAVLFWLVGGGMCKKVVCLRTDRPLIAGVVYTVVAENRRLASGYDRDGHVPTEDYVKLKETGQWWWRAERFGPALEGTLPLPFPPHPEVERLGRENKQLRNQLANAIAMLEHERMFNTKH